LPVVVFRNHALPGEKAQKGIGQYTASAKRCLGTVEQLGGISKIGSIGEFS
jgi:hypothetical protein